MKASDLQRKLEQARGFLLSHDFAQALPRYEKLARQYPWVAVIWMEYGNAASGLRDHAGAEKAWTRALELAPRNADLVGLIGHQYQAIRRPDQARACFAQAAQADPRGINPRISLAVLLEQTHRLAEARAAVEECLSIDPRDDQARYFLAVLDRREGLLEVAEQRLRDLMASDPKHPYVRYACRYELAQVLDRTDRFDEAMRLLGEAKEMVRTLTDTVLLTEAYDEDAANTREFTRGLPKDVMTLWGQSFPEAAREQTPRLAFLGGTPQERYHADRAGVGRASRGGRP